MTGSLDADIKESEAFVYEAGLQPDTTAQTVSIRDGRAETESGGIADSGEVLAGFYVIDVADAGKAVEWAKRIPTAAYGRVEARPIVEF